MTIELVLSNLRSHAASAIHNSVLLKVVSHEVEKILKTHKEQTVKEIEDFIAQISVCQNVGFMAEDVTITVRIPDLKE